MLHGLKLTTTGNQSRTVVGEIIQAYFDESGRHASRI